MFKLKNKKRELLDLIEIDPYELANTVFEIKLLREG